MPDQSEMLAQAQAAPEEAPRSKLENYCAAIFELRRKRWSYEKIAHWLKERGVSVRELRFRVGAVPPVERPPERRIARAVPAIREVPAELAQVLAGVDDAGLRAVIESAAAANLAWQSVTRPAPQAALTEAQRAARAPRSAAEESAPPARTSPASREGAPRRPGDERGRPR